MILLGLEYCAHRLDPGVLSLGVLKVGLHVIVLFCLNLKRAEWTKITEISSAQMQAKWQKPTSACSRARGWILLTTTKSIICCRRMTGGLVVSSMSLGRRCHRYLARWHHCIPAV